jgi:hypothetical protein
MYSLSPRGKLYNIELGNFKILFICLFAYLFIYFWLMGVEPRTLILPPVTLYQSKSMVCELTKPTPICWEETWPHTIALCSHIGGFTAIWLLVIHFCFLCINFCLHTVLVTGAKDRLGGVSKHTLWWDNPWIARKCLFCHFESVSSWFLLPIFIFLFKAVQGIKPRVLTC